MNPITWPDLFVNEGFVDPILCQNIAAEMNAAQTEAATVYGRTASGAVEQNVRNTLRVRPSEETVALITRRLLDAKQAVGKHFGIELNEVEDPQFLRYRQGDFFVAHQDGNTGLLQLDTERRRVSTIIFLSRESDSPAPEAHCGGSLLFINLRARPNDNKFRLFAEPGTLVAFRSETTHEVTPVTHGERLSIVSWYR